VWECNRGILGKMKVNEYGIRDKCLCPPNYYGERCEYQNERVSLSIQIKTSGEWRTIFTLIAILIDNENIIHSSDQIIYVSSRDCQEKFDLYLLYQTQ